MKNTLIYLLAFASLSMINFANASSAHVAMSSITAKVADTATRDASDDDFECGVYTNKHKQTMIGCNYNGTYVECPFDMPSWCARPE